MNLLSKAWGTGIPEPGSSVDPLDLINKLAMKATNTTAGTVKDAVSAMQWTPEDFKLLAGSSIWRRWLLSSTTTTVRSCSRILANGGSTGIPISVQNQVGNTRLGLSWGRLLSGLHSSLQTKVLPC